MDVSEAILSRRAIRKYKPDPVPDELLRQILAEARWAPSATNTQSTNVYVLAGEPFAKFKAELRAYAESEVAPNPDFPPAVELPSALKARQERLFQARMAFVAAEEAKLGLQPAEQALNPAVAMADIFGAPLALVLTFDERVSPGYGCFDAGLFAMALCLAAHARGLGTCITGSNVRYPDLLRKVLPGTGHQKIVALIALGYPDYEAPVNRFPRERITVEEFVTFVR